MTCTRCGHTDSDAHTYCRRCGSKLPQPLDERARKEADGRMNVMITFNLLSALFALTSVIVLYATYLGKPEAKWSIFVAGALCMVIAVHQSFAFAFALDLKLRLKRERSAYAPEPPPPVAALPSFDTSAFVDVPSVTESTTDLLPSARRARTTGELRRDEKT